MADIVIYEAEDGTAKLSVQIDEDTVWLSLDQIAQLFGRDKSTISRHLKNIFDEGELQREATVAKNATVQTEGSRQVERDIDYYNLDAIISVGYRVSSKQATAFRKWATGVLKEYIIKAYAMDDERLKNLGGGTYWYELLERIRDIRSSEKVLYRQVLDLYATAIDYDPQADESIRFFRIIQNKMHFAAHGQTAAEVIWDRADANVDFMGLTNFKGAQVTLADVRIAKNYLTQEELEQLNGLVSGYFDLAETNARAHKPMYMDDHLKQIDGIFATMGRGVLQGAGGRTHAQAMQKAESEYRKYQERELSPVEQAYFETIKRLESLPGPDKRDE